MEKKPDYFKDSASSWDKASIRVNNAKKIAAAILNQVDISKDAHLMDFGAGTGLLSEGLAPYVRKITAMDYSQPMLDEFLLKSWACEIDILHIDLVKATLDHTFDGIISSMTLHHIEDIDLLFGKFNDLLDSGSFVALADLNKEDGSFHSNNQKAGAIHFGFEEGFIKTMLEKNGFENINFVQANVIRKPVDDVIREYPVFLVTAFKK